MSAGHFPSRGSNLAQGTTTHGGGVTLTVAHMLNSSLLVKKKKGFTLLKNFLYRRYMPFLPPPPKKKVQTAYGANPASFNRFPGLFVGVKRPGREVTTRLHLVLRSKMSGAVPLLPIHNFMACTWGNMPCILYRKLSSSTSAQANLNILFHLFFRMYTYQAVSLLFHFCVFVLFLFYWCLGAGCITGACNVTHAG